MHKKEILSIVVLGVLLLLGTFVILFINKPKIEPVLDDFDPYYAVLLKEKYPKDEFVNEICEVFEINEKQAFNIFDNPEDYVFINLNYSVINKSNREIYDFNVRSCSGKCIYIESEDFAHYALRNVKKNSTNDFSISFLMKTEQNISEQLKNVKFKIYSNPFYGFVYSKKSEPIAYTTLTPKNYKTYEVTPTDDVLRFINHNNDSLQLKDALNTFAYGACTRITQNGYYIICPYNNNGICLPALFFFDKSGVFLDSAIIENEKCYSALEERYRNAITETVVDEYIITNFSEVFND